MENSFRLKKYKVNNNISFRKILDEYVIVNTTEGEVLTINETGGTIFQLIFDNKNIEEIIQHITSTFDISEKDFEEDLKDYLNLLLKNGIITEDV